MGSIRAERKGEEQAIHDLVQAAFLGMDDSDQQECYLVDKLRKSPSYIPELSLVYEQAGVLLGHVLLTRAQIKNKEISHEVLALAPISVLPVKQQQGVGTALMQSAHERARDLGFKTIVVIGHADYYPRFGYKRASKYGIKFPFEVPDENGFVLFLDDRVKAITSGMVVYDTAFY